MATKKQNKRVDIRHAVLIGYLSVCIFMVAATLALALTESIPGSVEAMTPTVTPTRSPMVLTLQAESYEEYDHEHQGQGAGRGGRNSANEQATATVVPGS